MNFCKRIICRRSLFFMFYDIKTYEITLNVVPVYWAIVNIGFELNFNFITNGHPDSFLISLRGILIGDCLIP